MDEAASAKDIFNIAKWHKSRGKFTSPPLEDPNDPDGPPAQSPESKGDLLARCLLANQSEVEDIPLTSPAVASTPLPFPKLTSEELSRAIVRASNTTPGEDRIPTAVLRLAWPQISDLVLDLFQACLDTGHHPKCFRTAILAIIEKPNKLDISSPRSYRPIALLSVLGKGLERLVTRRMSWIAIKHKLLTRQQFGALPLRSSVDLTTCLTHDIENALARGETASIATLDIKGAFDAVLPGRLVRRLREQGWPSQICNWVGSFATERKFCIRLDGEIGDPRPIFCGLPQGSPISPILFMLYISPLFRLNGLQKAFRKSELLHFSRKNRDKHLSPQVHTNDFNIMEDTQKPYLKWLGVHFDKKLTFKYHVKIQAAKALKITNALRGIGNTIRGVSPKLSKQMVTAYVLPVAHFGAETWWPGKTRDNGEKLACARAILPVFRTTPSTALLRETGLSPAQIELDNIARRAAVRTRKLDSRHPLYIRSQASNLSRANSRLTRWCRAVTPSKQINPLASPPWEIKEPRENSLLRVGAPTVSNERRVDSFQTFLQNIPKSGILVYTDGSKLSNGNAGSGYVIYQLDLKVCSGAVPLGISKEIFDAEAYAALCGIQKAVGLSSARFANNVWVFLDNLQVALQLLSLPYCSTSQSIFLKAIEFANKWKTRERLPHTSEGQVKIRWVPGHSGVEGNKLADLEAKKGASMPCLDPLKHSLSSLKKWQKAKKKAGMNGGESTSRHPTPNYKLSTLLDLLKSFYSLARA
ncbi:hypothetical protein K3495_g13685 [Podosphaera aphanis]|nr:hypothetical protein K3495_g13685 [Podosphaera aphanis]